MSDTEYGNKSNIKNGGFSPYSHKRMFMRSWVVECYPVGKFDYDYLRILSNIKNQYDIETTKNRIVLKIVHPSTGEIFEVGGRVFNMVLLLRTYLYLGYKFIGLRFVTQGELLFLRSVGSVY